MQLVQMNRPSVEMPRFTSGSSVSVASCLDCNRGILFCSIIVVLAANMLHHAVVILIHTEADSIIVTGAAIAYSHFHICTVRIV